MLRLAPGRLRLGRCGFHCRVVVAPRRAMSSESAPSAPEDPYKSVGGILQPEPAVVDGDKRDWKDVRLYERAGFRTHFKGVGWEALGQDDPNEPYYVDSASEEYSQMLTDVLDRLKDFIKSPPKGFNEQDLVDARELYENLVRRDVHIPEEFPPMDEWMRETNYVRTLRPHVKRMTMAVRLQQEHELRPLPELPEDVRSRSDWFAPILERIERNPYFTNDQKAEMVRTMERAAVRTPTLVEKFAVPKELAGIKVALEQDAIAQARGTSKKNPSK